MINFSQTLNHYSHLSQCRKQFHFIERAWNTIYWRELHLWSSMTKNYKTWVNYIISSLRAKKQWRMISEMYLKSQKNKKKTLKFIKKLKKWDTVDQKIWTDIAFFYNYADSTHYIYKTVKKLWDCLKRIKKLIESIYYLIRALINYKQDFKKMMKQMLNTLRII